MTESKKVLARALIGCGAVKFGSFDLKHNEKDATAEKAPQKFELRTPDHPRGGPLTPEIVDLIGRALYEKVPRSWKYDHVAGVPDAGDPLTSGFNRAHADATGFPTSQLWLGKEEGVGSRRIKGVRLGNFDEGDSALVIDDAITYGQSKLEAFEELELQGLRITGLAVVINREQGGRQILEKSSYEFVAVFTISELMELYLTEGSITRAQADAVMAYVARNQAA